jgi:hypothetical protein
MHKLLLAAIGAAALAGQYAGAADAPTPPASSASSASPASPASQGWYDIPANLRPPEGEQPFLRLRATGVQIYECLAKPGAPGAWAWTFKAPEAELVDISGRVVARHFAGPSWAWGDGSTIVGKAGASAPAPDGHSIPWLLLTVASHTGEGVLAPATSVQRLDTIGGAAPDGGCTAANEHQVARSAYSANYVVWRRSKAG